MQIKERFFYIVTIIILAFTIGWFIFGKNENYVDEYNAKIEALEAKVDSLHNINDELALNVDKLNVQITQLDQELFLKDNRIKNLKYEISAQVNAVDNFNDDELERFFTERYRQYLDSIAKTNSPSSN